VLLLGEKTVDVDSQRPFALQHRGCEPHFTAALDRLLQSLLNEIRLGDVTETAHGGFNFADALEIGKRIDPARQVLREIYLSFDSARVPMNFIAIQSFSELNRRVPIWP
jgi:hypothetical protein